MKILGIALCLLVAGSAAAQTTTTVNAVVPLDVTVPTGCVAKFTAPVGGHQAITVTCPTAPKSLSITSPVTLPGATVGTAYTFNLDSLTKATGGQAPYTYKAVSGFPTWLVLSPTGVLQGVPDKIGNSTLIFSVTDSSGITVTNLTKRISVGGK